MSKSTTAYRAPTQEEIAACAHRIYESEGRPQGKAMEHWLQAETQLITERKAAAGTMPAITTPAPKNRAPEPMPPSGNSMPQTRQRLHQN
jgi:hypothetical protein